MPTMPTMLTSLAEIAGSAPLKISFFVALLSPLCIDTDADLGIRGDKNREVAQTQLECIHGAQTSFEFGSQIEIQVHDIGPDATVGAIWSAPVA